MTTLVDLGSSRRRTVVQVGWRVGAGIASLAAAVAILYGSGHVALGVYAASWTITIILSLLLGSGFTTAISWSVATGRATAGEALRSAIPATLLMAAPFVLGALALMSFGLFADRVAWLGVAIALPLFLFEQAVLGALQGEYRTDAHAAVVSAQPLALLGLAVAFWIAGPPVGVGVWLVAFPVVAQAVLAYVLEKGFWGAETQGGLVAVLVQYTRQLYLGSLAWMITTRADLVLVSTVLGAAPAGTYGLALTLGEGSVRFAQGAATVLFARAARHDIQAAAWEAHRLARTSSLLTFAACVATALAVAAAGIYDERLVEVAELLLILSVGISLLAAGVIYGSYFTARGNPERATRVALLVAPLALIGYAALIPPFGLVGGALASSISYGALGVLSWVFVPRDLTAPPGDERTI
jgi:O-antigen/teichoic acid export membrane protein